MWDDELDQVSRWSARWFDSLAARPVGVPVAAADVRAGFDERLPTVGEPPGTVLDDLARAWERGLVASAGPRYFGFVTGGALPAAVGAEWLVTAVDQNAGTYVMSPAAAVIEDVTAGWVLDLLGLPDEAAVGFVTGAQTANVTCLAAARRSLLAAQGWDDGADGLAGAPVPTVLIGDQVHATLIQALRLLGLGSARAVRVAVDDQGRMRADALRDRLSGVDGPVLVCAQVGNVATGACDPLEQIADVLAGRPGSWLHVDGAFGLWAAAAPGRCHLVRGAERADSWAVDAHKWLNVPYDSAMAVVRDAAALTGALTLSAAYLPLGDLDPSARTPENSRRARAVPVYAALRSLGRSGVADLVERCCLLAVQAARELGRHPRMEVLNDVVLNQLLVRVVGADARDLAAAVQRDGTCWVGTTVWDGEPALRFSVSNWSTTPADVTRSTTRIRELLDDLAD